MKYTWNMLYERADGAGCGDPKLKAKDEARWQVGRTMIKLGYPDPEYAECPEEKIEDFCEDHKVWFDENGNILEQNGMRFGDIVVVLVKHPLGLYTIDYNTEGKCGIVTDICDDGTIGLNDGFLYLENELRPATEIEKRAFTTALSVSYVRDLIDITHWIKE